MNVVAPSFAGQPVGVSVAHDPRGLSAFLEPECAAALWERELPYEVTEWLEGLDPDQLPRGRVILPVAAIEATLSHLFDMAKIPESADRAWVEADILNLAEQFAALMDTQYLRLRLDVVNTNACRKFHIDAITARLICTYRGTGTQYGTAAMGEDPREIFTVPKGAPFLMRGTAWPSQPAAGLLHRSPQIEGTGETRFVLVLDPMDDPV